ncbi:MAG: hypothetical protein Tsb009_37470 [Planctomycetaceae bacterium]
MAFTRRFLHYSPGPADFVAEIECRSVGNAWFELHRQGGCGAGELTLLDEFTSQTDIAIGDWIAFEYNSGTRWYLGQVTHRSRQIPAGMRIRLQGMSSQLDDVFPGGYSRNVADGVPPHRYGKTDLFSHDPDYSDESVDLLSDPAELITKLMQQYVVPKTDITLDTNLIESPLVATVLNSLKFRGEESVREILDDMAVRSRGASWGVDENGVFYFLKPRTNLLASYRVGRDLLSLDEFHDRSLIFNRVHLLGGNIYRAPETTSETPCCYYRWQGHYLQPASRTKYGDRQIEITVPWIRTAHDSREFAREFFRMYSEPLTRFLIEVGNPTTIPMPWDGQICIEDQNGTELISDYVETIRVHFDQAPSFRFMLGPGDPRERWPARLQNDRWPIPGPENSEWGGSELTFSSSVLSGSSGSSSAESSLSSMMSSFSSVASSSALGSSGGTSSIGMSSGMSSSVGSSDSFFLTSGP